MNSQKCLMNLHKAARMRRVNNIRQLLYEDQCDPNAVNFHGKTAAFMYFINLLTKANDCGSDDCLTHDELSCFTEMLWFTYDTSIHGASMGKERWEIFDMLDYCYQFSDVPIRKLYLEIINVFVTPAHYQRYFVENILAANLPSDYSLIAVLFDMNHLLRDDDFVNLRANFLSEMFTLFIVNETFFEEYISQVMSSGWTFTIRDQSWPLCSQLLQHHHSFATIFRFMKYLIRYGIDFTKMLRHCINHLPLEYADDIAINVFVPLSTFVNAPIDLARTIRREKRSKLSYYNFNETYDVLADFNAFIEMECDTFQVVSLKNLARMSVRQYFFRKHTHYKAVSLLHSLNIPITVRCFLCYNYCNLTF